MEEMQNNQRIRCGGSAADGGGACRRGEKSISTRLLMLIAEMPLEDKVTGLFIITPEVAYGYGVVCAQGDTQRKKLRECCDRRTDLFGENINQRIS